MAIHSEGINPAAGEREALLRDLYTLRGWSGGDTVRRIDIVDRAIAALSRPDAPEPGARLDLKFREDLVEYSKHRIAEVWGDPIDGADAETLARQVVGAQEWMWLARGFPIESTEIPEPQGEPSGAQHADHVTVSWAYDGNCLEGECDHIDDDGEPEDLSACPNVPPFEVCVDCMDEDGRGRDPEHWDDVPLISWPCAALRAAGGVR